jgi:acyl-CoA dehydrogenase
MGKSDPDNDAIHKQQSMILVPADTPGITVHRMLSVFGYDDAPHGHGQISFNNVRVPADNILLGEGRGFEIAQGRLGPGRIHHAMRSIGGAERALDFFIARINDPNKVAFGLPLHRNPVMLSRVAECRMQIDAARLVVLNAAIAIDELGSAGARKEIAEAKVVVPKALLFTLVRAFYPYMSPPARYRPTLHGLERESRAMSQMKTCDLNTYFWQDYAIQAYGAQGVCQDTPLAQMVSSYPSISPIIPLEAHIV